MEDIKKFVTLYADKNSAVKLITINGYQMNGVINSVDSVGITIISDNRAQFVFYHAISTIEFKT